MAEIIQIDSNTWRIEDGFVRFFLLEGEEKAVLIDSGVNCLDASDIAKRVLYAGDSVQKGHIYMFGMNRCPEMFEQSLDKLIALKDEYDCIYASHDSYMVSNDYAEEVKKAWALVQSGEVTYEMINLFGNMVKSFTTQICGFYME